MKRVGIAGFLHESNTFLAAPTTYEHFASTTLTGGDRLLDRWTGAHHEIGGFLEGCADFGMEAVPLLATFAVPSGTISAEAFERIVSELLDAVRKAGPLDGLLIALHGATVSESFPDADGEVLSRLRAVLPEPFPMVVTFDLHANISDDMIRHSTAAVVYRSNPHLDQEQRGVEAAGLLRRVMDGEVRPVQALEAPPLIIAMSKQYTSAAPAVGLYSDLADVLKWPGILSASIAMGFYYSDVREMGASFLAVSDGDPELARRAARWMATRAWDRRHEFAAGLPTMDDAVRKAVSGNDSPVALMDVGDNVGGGSPADSTLLFAEVLRQGIRNALVILYDPESVRSCVEAGPGATVSLSVGGKTGADHGNPIPIRGVVRNLSDGHFVETQVRHGGWGACWQGVTAVVETAEEHTVILTSRRMAPMSLEQILSVGVHPERKRILIVKGVVAPRAAYEPISSRTILVDTAGATSDNPLRFEYRHRRPALFPLEPDAEYGGES